MILDALAAQLTPSTPGSDSRSPSEGARDFLELLHPSLTTTEDATTPGGTSSEGSSAPMPEWVTELADLLAQELGLVDAEDQEAGDGHATSSVLPPSGGGVLTREQGAAGSVLSLLAAELGVDAEELRDVAATELQAKIDTTRDGGEDLGPQMEGSALSLHAVIAQLQTQQEDPAGRSDGMTPSRAPRTSTTSPATPTPTGELARALNDILTPPVGRDEVTPQPQGRAPREPQLQAAQEESQPPSRMPVDRVVELLAASVRESADAEEAASPPRGDVRDPQTLGRALVELLSPSPSRPDGRAPTGQANQSSLRSTSAPPSPEPGGSNTVNDAADSLAPRGAAEVAPPQATSSPRSVLAARVQNAVDTLRHGPPPERVSIDLAELVDSDEPLRVTVSMRGGAVHLSGSPQTGQQLSGWWNDVAASLAERGLTFGGWDDQHRDDQPRQRSTSTPYGSGDADEGEEDPRGGEVTVPDDSRAVWL